jgi:two-component system invasion response regulator UvrY
MQLSSIKIAIADDHMLVRNGIISLINTIDHCEVIADGVNGKDLISNIAALETKPDVSILDISMPVLNGYETIIELKRLYPDMKFLVLTMFEEEYSIIKMIKNGANGYILKGCSTSELQNAITEIYNNGYYYSTHGFKRIDYTISESACEATCAMISGKISVRYFWILSNRSWVIGV